MARGRRVEWLAATVLLPAALAGQWDNVRRTRAVHERMRFNQELLRVALGYHRFAEERGFSPRGLADIEEEQRFFPQVYEMLGSGAFVVRWDALLSADGAENERYVLGYEARVTVEGGWVLMGGGGRRQVSAAEFHTLPLIPTSAPSRLNFRVAKDVQTKFSGCQDRRFWGTSTSTRRFP